MDYDEEPEEEEPEEVTLITCACGCNRKRFVRSSDLDKSWVRYFSKQCTVSREKVPPNDMPVILELRFKHHLKVTEIAPKWDCCREYMSKVINTYLHTMEVAT